MKLRAGVLVLIVSLIATVFYLVNRVNSVNAERDAWMAQAALNDSLHQIEAGRYQRAAVTVTTLRQLRSTYEDSLPKLHTDLRNLRAKEQLYLRAIATLEADTTVAVAVTDTIIVEGGTTVSRVTFELEFEGCTVSGYTRTPPSYAEATVSYKPIPLSVVISELRDGSLQTNVETAPWVTIGALDTFFMRKEPSWLQRKLPWFALGLGIVLGHWLGG